MEIKIVSFGRIKNQDISSQIEYYQKLAKKYCKLENIVLKDKKEKKIGLDEILAQMTTGSYNIILSEDGKLSNTHDFAKLLKDTANNYTCLKFFVGNAYGFEDECKKKANLTLSLSPMTMNHELARLVLLEQIFRCLNFLSGGKYHK